MTPKDFLTPDFDSNGEYSPHAPDYQRDHYTAEVYSATGTFLEFLCATLRSVLMYPL